MNCAVSSADIALVMCRTPSGKVNAMPLIVKAVSTTTDMHTTYAQPTLTCRRPPFPAATGIQNSVSAMLPNAMCVQRML